MNEGEATILRFDDFEVDTDAFELRRDGSPVPLEPQAFDVLLVLLRRHDRVVPKTELLDEIWESRFVSESALTTRIKQVRRALGDDGRTQRFVKTVHGRGYRFVGELLSAGVPSVSAHDLASAEMSLGGRAAPDLLERAGPLKALVDALERAGSRGDGTIVLVEGDAGLGKTSLVRSFRALAGGSRMLIGGCDDLLSPRVLGPIRDMTEVSTRLADAVDHAGDPDAVLAAVLDLLSERPATMVVEDVHWADDATLDLIRLVARRIEQLPAVLVLTYRPPAPDHPLRRVLGTLGGPHVERLTLDPLSPDAVGALAAAFGRSSEDIFETTRGNPFFVTEVLASPDERVPATVRDAVLSRLVPLSPSARQLVAAASVVPSRAERWLVETLVSDRTESMVEAEVAGVLGVGADHVWFRHELARRAVEDSLPTVERLRLHRAVLDALEGWGEAGPTRLVHHAQQAGDAPRVHSYAVEAIEESIHLRSYRQTMDLVDLLLDGESSVLDEHRLVALTRGAYALYGLNRLGQSAAFGRRAVALAERIDAAALVDALLTLSRSAFWSEGPDEAGRCIRRAIELLDGTADAATLASAYADLARAHSNLGNVGIVAEPDPQVIDAASASLELAERTGRADLRGHALQYLGSGRLALGDERGIADLQRAVALAEVNPRDELPVRACVNAARSLFQAGRFPEALHYVELGLERAADGEFFAGEYRLELTRAGILIASGAWDTAIEQLSLLLTRAGEPGIMQPLACTMLARVHARRAELDVAADVLDPAIAAASGSADLNLLGPVAAAIAELAWLTGDVDGLADPPLVDAALLRAQERGHRVTEAELVTYLRRCGRDPRFDGPAPGPWAATTRASHATAADEWSALGERYESAVELHFTGREADQARAVSLLEDLGASATVAALTR